MRERPGKGPRPSDRSRPTPRSRPTFEPHTEFVLDPEAACYVVTIELPVPIDIVAVKSSVRVELLETAQNTSIAAWKPTAGSGSGTTQP